MPSALSCLYPCPLGPPNCCFPVLPDKSCWTPVYPHTEISVLSFKTQPTICFSKLQNIVLYVVSVTTETRWLYKKGNLGCVFETHYKGTGLFLKVYKEIFLYNDTKGPEQVDSWAFVGAQRGWAPGDIPRAGARLTHSLTHPRFPAAAASFPGRCPCRGSGSKRP